MALSRCCDMAHMTQDNTMNWTKNRQQMYVPFLPAEIPLSVLSSSRLLWPNHRFENVRRKCRSAYRFCNNCCTQTACWTWQNSDKTEQLTIVHTFWQGERNQSHRNGNVEHGSYGAINKINKHVWESSHPLETYIFEWLVRNSMFLFCRSFLEFPNGLRITRWLFTVGRRIRVHSPVTDHYPLKINKYRRCCRRQNFICDCWLSLPRPLTPDFDIFY